MTPAEHAATVRAGITETPYGVGDDIDKALAALDALQAQAEDSLAMATRGDQLAGALAAAEAERDRLAAEVEEWKREAQIGKWPKEAAQEFHRLKYEHPRLAARVSELEAALADARAALDKEKT